MAREVGNEGGGQGAQEEDEDDELIPKMVQEVVVGKVKDVLNWSWDAGSAARCARALPAPSPLQQCTLSQSCRVPRARCAPGACPAASL